MMEFEMFGRLKRMESLLTELVQSERECLDIVRESRLILAAREAQDAAQRGKPWKCEFPGCTVAGWHAHTIIEQPSPNSGEVKS